MDGPGASLLAQTFILCFIPGVGAAPPPPPPPPATIYLGSAAFNHGSQIAPLA